MDRNIIKNQKRIKRKLRLKQKVQGSEQKPRLSVFRSNKHIYAQLINDTTGRTLASASDIKVKSGSNQDKAKQVGQEIAKLAKKVKVEKVVFDRNGYKYHGRLKALADGAREAGLNF